MKTNDTGFKSILAEKMKNQLPPTDERTESVNMRGLAAAGCVAILYAVGRVLYVGFHGELALPELILLFIMVIVMVAAQRQSGIYNLPRLFGTLLDPAVVSRKKRICFYAAESLLYAGSYTLLDRLAGITSWNRTVGGLAADFAIGFTVWVIGTYLINEYQIRKYVQVKAKMDAEESTPG